MGKKCQTPIPLDAIANWSLFLLRISNTKSLLKLITNLMPPLNGPNVDTNLPGPWAPEQAGAGRSRGIRGSSQGGRAGILPRGHDEGRMLLVLLGSPQVLLSTGCIEDSQGIPRHWRDLLDTDPADSYRLQSRDSDAGSSPC